MSVVTSPGSATASPPVLAAEQLRVRFGERTVLAGVSLALPRGTVTTLSGPSGGGKTTLLRVLGLLSEPDAGRVLLDGVDVRTLPPREARRQVALVAQAPAMFEGTVLDNVRTGPRLAGRTLDDATAQALLTRAGFDPAQAGQDARALSGGEKLRVALARALALAPRAWLLDEPTAALDAERADLVVDLLRALAAEGAAVLVVTHDARALERLGGRHLTLAAGRLSPDEAVAA